MQRSRWYYPVWHALAVFAGFFRRPGRFSVIHYPRQKALERIQQAHQGIVLDVGCGTRKLSEHVIAVDLCLNKITNVVADAAQLSFLDQSCDGIWLEAVLEHVSNPAQILREAFRVLKPAGWLYIEVPFLQGEHAAPSDFQRWTRAGLVKLLESEGWECEWIEMSSGPFSALAYQLRSCLSLTTSFGSDFLYRMTFEGIWGYVVWPIKFLDFLFRSHPRASEHAFGYAVMVRKRTRSPL